MTQVQDRDPPRSAHARKIRETVGASGTSVVSASWRRCLHLHRLDPDAGDRQPRRKPAALDAARRRARFLIAAAEAPLDGLFATLRGGACAILVTDADGTVVATRTDGDHDFWTRTGQPWTGLDLSEAAGGTNAAGLCLIEHRPIVIDDGDHFYVEDETIVSTGAPIFGATGALAGCLDVIRPDAEEPAFLGALILRAVIDGARRIELALFEAAYPQCRITLVPNAGRPAAAFLAIDELDQVVGASRAARRLLAPGGETIALPFPAAAVFGGLSREPTLLAHERAAIARTLARHKGNVSTAAKALGVSRGTLHRKLKGGAPATDEPGDGPLAKE